MSQLKLVLVQNKQHRRYFKWTDERISHVLKSLQSHPLTAIAKELETTPDSISKALQRRNISAQRTKRLARSRNQGTPRTKLASWRLSQGNTEPAIRAITYSSVHGCKWPIGDPLNAGFRFCNARRIIGSYCRAHYDAAYLREAA
jgi:hypothetical protein